MNNKVNRIRWDKLKAQFEILKMKAAYIEAEKAIMLNPSLTSLNNDLDAGAVQIIQSFQPMSPEEFAKFETDGFGNMKGVTIKELQIRELETALEKMEEQGRRLMDQEKYELMEELKELYEQTKKQIAKLRGDSGS